MSHIALSRTCARLSTIPRRVSSSSRAYSASHTSSSSSSSPHLLRNGLIATALLGAAGASYYYSEMGREVSHKIEVFTTNTNTSRGVVKHEHTVLSPAELSKRLHEHEQTVTFPIGKPTSVTRYDNNSLASNEPMEDRHAEDTVSKSMILPSGDQIEENIRLFSIFDGHGGTATSQLLTKTLHPMIILSLRSLYAGHYPTLPLQPNRSASSHILSYISSLTSPITSLLTPTVQITPVTISASLQSAFLTLDDQIISAPLKLIPHFPAKPGKPSVRPIIIPMVEPAVSGSCAITLMVDEGREELLVASTGDCRAVAGYWVEGEGWRCEVLTDDHMAKNPKEVQRLQGEHPPEEKDTVVIRGRLLGSLMPTRAFGDAKYKWTKEQYEGVSNMLPSDYAVNRHPTPYSRSPPYVTAKPEVTHKSLKAGAEGDLKFVVMATDGLWDRISSTEAVALVAAHIQHPRHAPIPATELASTLLPSSAASLERYPPQETVKGRSDWVFEDDNVATHLIKNSLAGSDAKKRNQLISMRAPMSRWSRDDITCTVVFFGEPPSSTTTAEPAVKQPVVKARL